ncbi:cytochrome ubiquinol oxidase subunit I [Oligoflexus tunisiensis]|uniref:cytochrome ubiquinol oxidase subunit I n=1 Tax=Oligoflexus tunisiensis TaxID=708132 RepID=UPI000A8A9971|nr:cytochrome ubiquinol oxidase subunit I [Oligoflexus tunisiensis]
MTDLLAARFQMALSLGFHIVFAAVGIAMPFLMSIAHHRYLKTRRSEFRVLTKAWSKTVAIFFAVGAVSGTALSFELGLLWPGFMIHAGPIIGMPFSWEGAAFFLEAIFIGIFLYGWKRLPERSHWLSGVMVGVSGVASGFFVICANGWMNSPAGFDWNNGQPINIDPWAAMFNDAALEQGVHMIIASFQAVGFAFAGVHALLYLRLQHPVHREAMKIAFFVGAVAALIQPISGDLAAKSVAERQPIKLAAMEGHFETEKGAPLLIGGLPDEEGGRTDYAIAIPKALSFLAFGDFDAEVKGLKDFPRELWPPVVITHIAFQIMVGIGTLMALAGALGLFWLWKRPENFLKPLWLKALVLMSPLGLIAIEAGWVVTEVGRQPWVIYGYLKTADALTPRPGIIYTFILYLVIYLALSLVVYQLVRRQILTLQQDLGQSQDKEGPA